VFAV